MAALSFKPIAPHERIPAVAIPEAIRRAIHHLFANCGAGVWLAGGTALAGYYAEHRSSDDIDLFAADAETHRAAVLAAKSLPRSGFSLFNERQTPLYYRTEVRRGDRAFTADVVLDEHLHRIGKAHRTADGTSVADLPTLFAMKVACLVSRCSEKDLFDLDWLFSNAGAPGAGDLIEIGARIDGAVSVETLLISLQGADLRKEACHFLLPHSKMTVDGAYRTIAALRKRIVKMLLAYEEALPPAPEASALRQAISDMKKLQR